MGAQLALGRTQLWRVRTGRGFLLSKEGTQLRRGPGCRQDLVQRGDRPFGIVVVAHPAPAPST